MKEQFTDELKKAIADGFVLLDRVSHRDDLKAN